MPRALLLLLILFAPGCTHLFLEKQTLHTASTLNSLQTQQVMDNLAVICANPEANPWHATLSAGLIQATDQGTGSFLATLQDIAPFRIFTPAATAQRSLTEQWSVGPVIDGGTLETLQIVYNKGLEPTNTNCDEKIRDQIVDLCVRFTLLPSEETLRAVLQSDECKPALAQLRITLGKDIAKLRDTANAAEAAMKQEKGKAYFELYQRKVELEDAIELRQEQMAELLRLSKVEKKEKRPARPRTVAKRSASSRRGNGQALGSAETSDTTLLILTAMQRKSAPGYLPSTDLMWESVRNPALVDQAEDQIGALEQLLGYEDETKCFTRPWLCHSLCKKDVPKCACAVGKAKVCGHECYVWVTPEDYGTLQRFTRIVMTLTASAQQDITSSSPTVTPGSR